MTCCYRSVLLCNMQLNRDKAFVGTYIYLISLLSDWLGHCELLAICLILFRQYIFLLLIKPTSAIALIMVHVP